MKGSFQVSHIVDRGNLGVGLAGVVVSGQLREGMEGRMNGVVIIIRELCDLDDPSRTARRAKKGEKILLQPFSTVFELLKALEGQTLEFEDIRSEPVKKELVLRPAV